MCVFIFLADCDENWERHGDKCYYYSSEYKNFEDTENFCTGLQGDLVAIKSEQHVTWLVTIFELQTDTIKDANGYHQNGNGNKLV